MDEGEIDGLRAWREGDGKKAADHFDTGLGAAGLIGLLAYYAANHYVQILTPGRYWAMVLAISAVGTMVVYIRFTRRLMAGLAKRSDRIGLVLASALAIVACVGAMLRIVNAASSVPLSREAWAGYVSDKSTWGGSHSSPLCFVEISLDSGESTWLSLSKRTYRGTSVGNPSVIQARGGLLGIPWCREDCLSP